MKAKQYNDVVPSNICRIIKERCFKQVSIAERAGYSKQQFSDMLNGRKIIKPCDVLAIADALGANVSDLFATDRVEL